MNWKHYAREIFAANLMNLVAGICIGLTVSRWINPETSRQWQTVLAVIACVTLLIWSFYTNRRAQRILSELRETEHQLEAIGKQLEAIHDKRH